MESTHWFDDLIEVETDDYIDSGLSRPSNGSSIPKMWLYLPAHAPLLAHALSPADWLSHVWDEFGLGFHCLGLEWGRLA